MTTIYCTRNDVASLIGEAGILACLDDDQDGSLTTGEQRYVTDCINRAAVEMNSALDCQYVLSELSGNDWCRWCNAYISVWHLQSRRANSPSGSVVDAVASYRDLLAEIRFGRFKVPEQAPSFDHLPSVSNFTPELGNPQGPIGVDTEKSTTTAPHTSRKRNKAGYPYSYW